MKPMSLKILWADLLGSARLMHHDMKLRQECILF